MGKRGMIAFLLFLFLNCIRFFDFFNIDLILVGQYCRNLNFSVIVYNFWEGEYVTNKTAMDNLSLQILNSLLLGVHINYFYNYFADAYLLYEDPEEHSINCDLGVHYKKELSEKKNNGILILLLSTLNIRTGVDDDNS